MDGYQKLANAVIIRAVNDYRKCRRKYLKHPCDEFNNRKLNQIEKFFCSDYFCLLSDLDGRILLEKIKKRVK